MLLSAAVCTGVAHRECLHRVCLHRVRACAGPRGCGPAQAGGSVSLGGGDGLELERQQVDRGVVALHQLVAVIGAQIQDADDVAVAVLVGQFGQPVSHLRLQGEIGVRDLLGQPGYVLFARDAGHDGVFVVEDHAL